MYIIFLVAYKTTDNVIIVHSHFIQTFNHTMVSALVKEWSFDKENRYNIILLL